MAFAAWTLQATLAAALVAAVVDAPVSRWFREHKLGGDVKRELEALQQFGGVGSALVMLLLIVLLDRQRVRRVLDWALAYGLTSLAVLAMKMAIGRPRPELLRPSVAPGGWTEQVVDLRTGATARAVELGAKHVERLWSMPSSHTAAAVVMAVYLAIVYPRLRPFCIAMAGLVGFGRIALWAHYPSDVVIGAGVAFLISVPVVRSYAGVRLIDDLYRLLVDREAEPAEPRMRAIGPLGGGSGPLTRER